MGAMIEGASRPDCGAIATFVGTTRVDEAGGNAVDAALAGQLREMEEAVRDHSSIARVQGGAGG